MMRKTALLLLSALAAHLARAAASATAGVELAGFGVPAAGSDFKGHAGGGISLAATATRPFEESAYGEHLVAQVEGLYLHTSGRNDIGGVSHDESLDAGFCLLNLGLGARRKNWQFDLILGVGFGGASISGNTPADDTAADFALQVKPRATWHFSEDWALFAEYRHLRSSSIFGDFFTGSNDERAIALHAFGIGVARKF